MLVKGTVLRDFLTSVFVHYTFPPQGHWFILEYFTKWRQISATFSTSYRRRYQTYQVPNFSDIELSDTNITDTEIIIYSIEHIIIEIP